MSKLRLTGEIPPQMVVKFKGEEIEILDTSNRGIIRVKYNNKNELIKFIKGLQNNMDTNCQFGCENTIHLQYTAYIGKKPELFESNYIKIDRLDCIIQVLNNITKDKIKIKFDKSLEDKSIIELLSIKRHITNRKRYKSEDNIKYIEV